MKPILHADIFSLALSLTAFCVDLLCPGILLLLKPGKSSERFLTKWSWKATAASAVDEEEEEEEEEEEGSFLTLGRCIVLET